MEEYPVIIVGSGPAGAACAKALKDEHIEALVVEKEKLPRDKICSGILFGQTQLLLQQYFGELPPEEMYCDPKIINASHIQEWNREDGFSTYTWEIPKDGQAFPQDYYNVWRNEFDYWLLQKTGIPYKDECRYLNHSIQGERVQVEVSIKGRENQNFYCTYLVGADGANSQLRKGIDPSYDEQNKEVVIYQTYYRFSDLGRLEDAHWYVFFEAEIGDMLSCVHRKDEYLTLCVGGLKGRNLKESMEIFKGFLAKEFHVVLKDRERGEGCILRQADPFWGNADKVLVTGEAAGMMYLNGEGISAALDSGYQAGSAIAQGIKTGGDILELYKKKTEGIVNHIKLCSQHIHFMV